MNKSTDSIKYLVETVIRFNQKYPKSAFVGIHGDQEPKNKKSYTDLLENMQKDQAVVNNNLNSTILISQALRPAWIRESITWKGTSKTMNEHILDTINHAALMCYHQNIKVINKWSDSVIKIATEKQKKVSIGFEVNNLYNAWPSADLETWWEKITKEPATTRFKVNQKDQILTFEEAMRDTQKRLSSEKSFDKMVIHSYSGYFEHWFGQATRDYILSLPTKSYEK
ncbi:MAG: hypothetical protein MK132_27800 [Lentisphaerales bacterium]|nr:hypothetical protein [Lentisphaerales bacterium]